ncbi:sodium:proton antiporter [Vibrio azureus]|uniref:Iron-sulfur cluster carrier protein n=1 Tax=Vibrio azureus NBRC 104587 TaxID=1219077 RepID=U3A262_9VIBR|nr:iron-sulfur cluster carrier protein ApbC [Vibrio azureus]AUI86482.1 sodium:proton antiporter [Vibrio azureus]GAD74096.1 Mrp protein [Vibrio azureus NBRC 104587]
MHPLISQQDICLWLNQFHHPQLVEGWANVHGIVSVVENRVNIALPFASNDVQILLKQWIKQQQSTQQVPKIDYHVGLDVKSLETPVATAVKGVKNIIAVSSAKGGVGKSTTAVNLALAMADSGAKVGLLDADIYGPSVPMMLGQTQAKPTVREDKWMSPIVAHGIYTHSIGYLVDKSEAAIWRGPMASRALSQLLNETDWPDLDYLVIDMPPGTGDIQLTLSQQIPVTGSVLITTPQDLALADARKGAAMFDKVNVPVVGVIENMSYHVCGQCGAVEHIFGVGGAEKMSLEFGLMLLGQIPLHISMREDIDAGIPTVARRTESEHAANYRQLADRICSSMYWQGKPKPDTISFTMVN